MKPLCGIVYLDGKKTDEIAEKRDWSRKLSVVLTVPGAYRTDDLPGRCVYWAVSVHR